MRGLNHNKISEYMILRISFLQNLDQSAENNIRRYKEFYFKIIWRKESTCCFDLHLPFFLSKFPLSE